MYTKQFQLPDANIFKLCSALKWMNAIRYGVGAVYLPFVTQCCEIKVQIPIDGIAYDTFMALLEFIYTGSLSCDPAITVDLLKCKYFLRNIQPAPQMFAALNKDVFLF